jgi:hypothetical protein
MLLNRCPVKTPKKYLAIGGSSMLAYLMLHMWPSLLPFTKNMGCWWSSLPGGGARRAKGTTQKLGAFPVVSLLLWLLLLLLLLLSEGGGFLKLMVTWYLVFPFQAPEERWSAVLAQSKGQWCLHSKWLGQDQGNLRQSHYYTLMGRMWM